MPQVRTRAALSGQARLERRWGILVIAPIVALFFLAQRYFIEGVTLTGLKG